jgi:hypothetical protein
MIVGVMPPDFQFPAECEIWTLSRFAVPEYPLTPTVDRSSDRGGHYFQVIGRVKSSVTLAQAQAEAEAIARRLKRQYGNDEEAEGAWVIGLREHLVGQTKPALLILLTAVTLLLLVACANVANLLLAKARPAKKRSPSGAHWGPAAGASYASFSPRVFCWRAPEEPLGFFWRT